MSFGCEIYFDQNSINDQYEVPVYLGKPSQNMTAIELYRTPPNDGNPNHLIFFYRNAGGTVEVDLGNAAALYGKWIHFAWTQSASLDAHVYIGFEGGTPGSWPYLTTTALGTITHTVLGNTTDTVQVGEEKTGSDTVSLTTSIARFWCTEAELTEAQISGVGGIWTQRAATSAVSSQDYLFLTCDTPASPGNDTGSPGTDWTVTGTWAAGRSVPPTSWSNRLVYYKFDEASSGTTPTTVTDSEASPLNLSITYGGGNWTSDSYGKALAIPDTASNGAKATVAASSKITSVVDGTATSLSVVVAATTATPSGGGVCFYGAYGLSQSVSDCLLWQCGDKVGGGQPDEWGMAATIGGTGGDYVIVPLPSPGYQVWIPVIETTHATAAMRARVYHQGFLKADATSGTAGSITQNATVVNAERIECGGINFDATTYYLRAINTGHLSIYGKAIQARDALRMTLRLFAANGNDADPEAAGASLISSTGPDGTSGGLGATTDASTSSTDHTAAPTVTIGASGLNRGVFLAITGAGVSAGVSGTPTLNSVNGTKVTNTLNSTNDVEWWWWKDSVLPSSAGTYNLSATVDGTNGTLACSVYYLEGVSQSAPTNFGSATGTSTSITASMTSNPSAGSILLGALLDATTGDAPTAGANQLPLAKVNGTSTGNTHLHVGSAKYITTSGADSMSWTNLTNSSAKIALAIEVKLAGTGSLLNVDAGTDALALTDSGIRTATFGRSGADTVTITDLYGNPGILYHAFQVITF
jgi:hypothetical protein